MEIRVILLALALVAAGNAWAKLPAAAPVDPAKAAADKQKADETAKKDAELLTKYQDKAVTNYHKGKGIKPAAAKK